MSMRAVRLHGSGGADDLAFEEVAIPQLESGEVLVRVHAAALTRDELEWPVDRLPAIPSYEVSGIVVDVAPGVTDAVAGDTVYALTPFDRDGAAAEYVAVPAEILGRKPNVLSDVESAAIPMTGLSAWQGLFDHGRLQAGERVLILGAAGGVGQLATQLGHERGAYVIGAASGEGIRRACELGADEAIAASGGFEKALAPVDLVFDTVGGDVLSRSAAVLREGGRLVSIAEEPPELLGLDISTTYFVVEPSREQLEQLTRMADVGTLRVDVDSVFSLDAARAAFQRVQARGKRGKVVLEIKE
jgi:NADPH:quinone reductase-like Zn-dependent oxidoreductase